MTSNSNETVQLTETNHTQETNLDIPELIFNLWYTYDKNGFIPSLHAKEYTIAGSKKHKLSFLKNWAEMDFRSSEWFKVPEKYNVHLAIYRMVPLNMNVTHTKILEHTNGGRDLFNDAIDKRSELYTCTPNLLKKKYPLVHITPRFLDAECQLMLPFSSINMFPDLD